LQTSVLPDPRAGVACALGHGEEHDVVVGPPGDRGVLRPVVRQVVHGHAGLGREYSFADGAVGVVRGAHQLDVGVALERAGVAGPAEEPRLEEVGDGRVGLRRDQIKSAH
jgi:hypothetical protein